MEKLKFDALIEKSIARTKKILFNPFSFKKWMALLLIAYLAGALSGGNSFNFRGNNLPDKKNVSEDLAQSDSTDEAEQAKGPNVFIRFIGDSDYKFTEFSAAVKALALSDKARPFVLGIGIFLFVIVGFIILFTWLYSRFLFIWFEAVWHDRTAIKEPFKRYAPQGSSMFKVSISVMVIGYGLFALIFWWALSAVRISGVFADFNNLSFKAIFNVLKLPILALFLSIVLGNLWHFFVSKFIVVFMAVKQISFWPAFNELSRVIRENAKDMFFYVLMCICLGIAAAILYVLAFIAAILAIGLAGAAVGGLLYFLIAVLFKAKIVFTVLAVFLGLCLMFFLILFFACMGLPIAVFFANFLLYFITNLNCGYDLIPLDEG